MSDGWIKMRASLLVNPKLIGMSRRLADNPDFREWLTPGSSDPTSRQLLSDSALRCVTCAALLKVWSVARMVGKFVGEDLVLEHICIADLDQIAEVPGIGEAMETVGWAVRQNGVTLPGFRQYNVPLEGRERQKAYRKRALRGVTKTLRTARHNRVTREEKSREESNSSKKKKNTSSKKIDLDRERREWAGVEEADWQAWSVAYPAVDVRSESRRALEWCLSNGAKGHKSNYRKFLTNWFQRTQDRGGGSAFVRGQQQGPSRVPAPPGKYDDVGTEL